MKKRIFLSIGAVTIGVLLVSFFGVFVLLYHIYSQIEFEQLAMTTELISGMVEQTGDTYLTVLDDPSYRLNWIDAEGNVKYDSGGSVENMGNHLYREEIQQALREGEGQSMRYSSTLASETFNIARHLSDGTFIRISVTTASIYGLLSKVIWPFVLLLLAVVALSLIIADHLSRNIVKPILSIDLDHPLGSCTYPQIQPLLERIDASNHQIARQMDELQMKSREFEMVSNNMDEGLILLSDSMRVITCNQAACKIFGIQDVAQWNPDSIEKLNEALQQASSGLRGTFNLHKNSHDYVVEVSMIGSRNSEGGYIILILDTTEKVEAQKRRQEFTANVTHELKTPIQTIMASTELLQAGMVKKEDEARFLKYISREASRLVEMINDIITLSRLDASYEEIQEEIDLTSLVYNIADSMQPACDARDIALNLQLEDIEIIGNAKIWQGIFGNLMENALKYNKDGGFIDVKLQLLSPAFARQSLSAVRSEEYGQENEVVIHNFGERSLDSDAVLQDPVILFQVKDSGIGIPPKYQERVFERFFRVDKSHSKKVGGSGLGLAIVNHAVESLHGWLELQSAENEGTTIAIHIPVPAKDVLED